MKIKRFEAPSMSEALRLVKKEFGEEAVILSAKNVKKAARLFGGRSGGQVIVTAAIDTTPAAQRPAEKISMETPAANMSSSGKGIASPPFKPAQGISRILQHFTPITRTGQKKLQPKLIRLMTQNQGTADLPPSESPGMSVYERLREQGLCQAFCDELDGRMAELIQADGALEDDTVSILAQLIDAKGWVVPMKASRRVGPRVIVLTGPQGVGKTTMAAKLAAHAVLNADEPVALLSLDDRRIAGRAELARYAGIMGVPFESAGDPAELSVVLQRMSAAHLVVDTPGLSPSDMTGIADLGRMLQCFSDPEIHLLIHAGAREQVMARTIDQYKPLNISRLLPTHVDWCRQFGPFLNQMGLHPWPITFLGTSHQVPEGLQLLTSRELAAMMLGTGETDQGQGKPMAPMGQGRPQSTESGQFVANRNSDIFHDRGCKSVSRINDDHVLIFKDPTDAMDQGFKPCRMCCMAHFVPKPINRLAHTRFAGSRN
ncbi:MAG: hypothetical protein C4519_04265 [Desulfobacteraceae bacterium]|nr:MAG: hypothetical protein C4519_04265 [Desulfobacteraceae bacterium]